MNSLSRIALAVTVSSGGSRILQGHPSDQLADLVVNRRSAGLLAGLPSPVELESSTVPPDDGLRFNNEQCQSPAWPKPQQPYPEDPVALAELRPSY